MVKLIKFKITIWTTYVYKKLKFYALKLFINDFYF